MNRFINLWNCRSNEKRNWNTWKVFSYLESEKLHQRCRKLFFPLSNWCENMFDMNFLLSLIPLFPNAIYQKRNMIKTLCMRKFLLTRQLSHVKINIIIETYNGLRKMFSLDIIQLDELTSAVSVGIANLLRFCPKD